MNASSAVDAWAFFPYFGDIENSDYWPVDPSSASYTIFMPTQQALAEAGYDLVQKDLTNQTLFRDLSQLILRHVVFDQVLYTPDIKRGLKSIRTSSDYSINVEYLDHPSSTVVIANTTALIHGDIPIINGVLHVIDR
jgi:uncharacterized surface protein with fasciclin (FAS1) repeats